MKYKKLRTRGHKVVLNRSKGGDAGIAFFLTIMGAFMFLPMLYAVMQSLKPLDELFMFPPRFFVRKPNLENFADLFSLMSDSWVPFSRYIFNTVFITAVGTAGNLLFASMAAYALAKMRFPGRKAVGGRKGHKNAAAARSRTARLTVQVLVGTAAAKGAQNALTHGQGALTPGPAPNGPAGPGCATAAVHAFTSFP